MKTPRPFVLAGAALLVLAAATFVADARFIDLRTFRDLDKIADIIVVARPVSTKETAEQIALPHITGIQVLGLSSEFEVSFVLKGDDRLKKLVVHHYRLADTPDQRMENDAPLAGDNGTALAAFEPKETTCYLLFLQREPDGRYAPIDQVDPAWTSILALSGTKWDKMKLEDFKDWLDAKKWLNERPDPGSALSAVIAPSGRGEGSLHEAALNGKLEKAKALLKADPDLVSNQESYASQSPLHMAAEYGHKDVTELLLANKANIEAEAYGGWTPLLNAVFGGHKDLVELLVANKANVNVKEEAGRTPLHVAAENGYTDIAALLLASKADVNVKNREGQTPLYIAAAQGYNDMVMLLLANQAEISATDNSGLTPLHIAARNGSKEAVELLLAARADPNAKDNAGQTPLDLATANNHKDIADLLKLKREQDKNALY